MNFKIISVALLLCSTAQAINPFEGKLLRKKCLNGRQLTGCKETLLEAYLKTELSESDENVNNATTYMMLFTRNNKKDPEYLDDCGGGLPQNTKFNPAWKTVIIVHGFLEAVCQVAWMQEMKDQLLYRDKYNVILIDYSWGNHFDYYGSVKNSPVTGKQIAFMISNLIKQSGAKPKDIHLIGHSLGSHVCGYAGHYVKELVKEPVRRITALDPAGPGFQQTSLYRRLDKDDAKFVDAIHTNGGDCVPASFGYMAPIGHIDFYPNGGSKQESCIPYIIQSFLKGDMSYASSSLALPLCYHKQSVQFYKVSINSCKCQFIGVLCRGYEEFKSGECKECGKDGSNCAVMGMDAEDYPWKGGSYYLETTRDCPYCDNKGIKRQGFPLLPPGRKKNSCFSKLPSILPFSGQENHEKENNPDKEENDEEDNQDTEENHIKEEKQDEQENQKQNK